MDKMKLYVWDNPYYVDYGHSMVFVIAPTLRQARIQAQQGKAYSFGYEQDSRPSVELGKPTRVVDLPCAEWHKWEE